MISKLFTCYQVHLKSALDYIENLMKAPPNVLGKGRSRKRKGRKPKLMGPNICEVRDKRSVYCEGNVPWRLATLTTLRPGTIVRVIRLEFTSRVVIVEVISDV